MQSEINADHCDNDKEACVGKAMAVLGVVLTALTIVIVVVGLFLE